MKTLNLYIDESGNLGERMGRYFLICALEVNETDVKSITSLDAIGVVLVIDRR